MTEPRRLTLENVSSEVDQMHIQVYRTTQDIKTKEKLIKKFRKEVEQSKEKCSFIIEANNKAQFEIKQAQKAIDNMRKTRETLKMANIELKTQHSTILYQEAKLAERIQAGIAKYEQLWLQCKARYESLPFVIKFLKAKDDAKDLEQKIAEMNKTERTLRDQIKAKTRSCVKLDRERIIELADFIINQLPKNHNIIVEKTTAIDKVTQELSKLSANGKENLAQVEKDNSESSFLLPRMLFGSFDTMESFDFAQEYSIPNYRPKRYENNTNNMRTSDEEYSPYFGVSRLVCSQNKTQNYAQKKLINILEDIQVDKETAVALVSKARPDQCFPTDAISSDKQVPSADASKAPVPMEIDDNEDVNLPVSSTQGLLLPPTQFADDAVSGNKRNEELEATSEAKGKQSSSQALKNSQEGFYKKKVSFDIPNQMVIDETEADKPEKLEKNEANETLESQLNVSALSDEGFAKMQDIIMKKHNLDTTPPFVFAKNNLVTMNLHKQEDAIVKSKFFQHEQPPAQAEASVVEKTIGDAKSIPKSDQSVESTAVKDTNACNINTRKRISEMNPDLANLASNSKKEKVSEELEEIKIPTFNQSLRSQFTSDYLDSSMASTTMDNEDVPHCIDSNLLLSPKADYKTSEMLNKPEKLSQDEPNFLSGLRKPGLFFFGSAETNTNQRAQNQNEGGFSFNFGRDDKKPRSGLFRMFQ